MEKFHLKSSFLLVLIFALVLGGKAAEDYDKPAYTVGCIADQSACLNECRRQVREHSHDVYGECANDPINNCLPRCACVCRVPKAGKEPISGSG